MPSGRDLAALELTMRGHRYVWGAIGPNTFDCSGLNWWALDQLGVPAHRQHRTAQSLYDWCQAAHTTISPAQAKQTVGAWGFYGRDGKIHHIVTSLGNGSTIQAANKRDGVGVFKWDDRQVTVAGLPPGLTFGDLAPHPPPVPQHVPTRPTLILSNPNTRANQVAIGELIFISGVDLKHQYAAGTFDAEVLADVVNFQRFFHLPVTGQFDTLTWTALDMLIISKGAQTGTI